MSNQWFTSDTHYGHRNIIQYCDRPFVRHPITNGLMRPSEMKGEDRWLLDANRGEALDVQAMDEEMVRRWNARVRPGDFVYHLGDVMLGPDLATRLAELRRRLNGTIVLVLGNHDRSPSVYWRAGFDVVCKGGLSAPIGTGPESAYMCHHPLADDQLPAVASYRLVLNGHVHEKWRTYGPRVNVGVDQWDLAPVHVDELLAISPPEVHRCP